ncbi:MAG: thiosulfate oxidation carrier complex protein SoxZ [Candidatus Parabeggiatoa sp.]|nr:thiosulfate oxidation carrier complex protein SoxZ [Candidatus Parabeggiatoa sp.]
MADEFRTRLQAKLKKGITEVRTKITHPMETGARRALETGKLIPAHFIEEVKVEHNGKVVMSADWSVGISKDPYCAFKFKGGVEGDTVTLTWKDNKGNTKTKAVTIK